MSKLKRLWNADASIEEVTQNVHDIRAQVSDIQTDIATLRSEVTDVHQHITSLTAHLDSLRHEVIATGRVFKEELERFRNLKRQLQREFLARGEEELSQVLKNVGEKVKIEQQEYQEIKQALTHLCAEVPDLRTSFRDLKAIVSTIKKEDFHMDRTIGKIHKNERERYLLQRRIDQLERMIGRRRRERRQTKSSEKQ